MLNKTNNQTNNEANITSYNKNLAAYQKKSQPISETEEKFILRSLSGISKHELIVEIGSGLGERSDLIEQAGYQILRTDASQSFVDYLNQRHKVLKINALSDPIPSCSVIFASAVFLHFSPDDLFFILRKIYHLLPEHGRLVFSLKAGRGPQVLNEGEMGVRFFYFYQPGQIIDFLDRSGFSVREMSISGFQPTWIQISAVKRSADFPF